jgi:hypothetical protein
MELMYIKLSCILIVYTYCKGDFKVASYMVMNSNHVLNLPFWCASHFYSNVVLKVIRLAKSTNAFVHSLVKVLTSSAYFRDC